MNVAVVYNQPDPNQLDSLDVQEEIALVADSLRPLGHSVRLFAITGAQGSPDAVLQEIKAYGAQVIFNLVESFGPDPRQQAKVAALWEQSGIPMTGASAKALLATTDKTLAKSLLQAAGIPTPPWQVFSGQGWTPSIPSPWLCKPAWEDASVGITDGSVVAVPEQLKILCRELGVNHPGQPILVETYLEGREFNVSLLQTSRHIIQVLPPAELLFENWPAQKPRIVGYAAKWLPDTFEYQNTRRSFKLEPLVIRDLTKIALDCWACFHLNGYARVDFRQGADGKLYVIEVNANPGIAPDSGFIAAVQHSGRSVSDAMALILSAAMNASKYSFIHH